MKIQFRGVELGQTDSRQPVIRVENFDPGYHEVLTSDAQLEGRDGVSPGRDFFGSATWSLDLSTNGRNMLEARETLREFFQVWRDATSRRNAGVTYPLDYQVVGDDQWRRVYGRPRRSDNPDFDFLMRLGRGRVTIEFEVMDPRSFTGGELGEFSTTIGQVEGSLGGGMIFPLQFPFSGGPVSGQRTGTIDVGGDLPTPVVIEFRGPGSGLTLTGGRGWHVGLRSDVTLAADETIILDSRSETVTDNWGNQRQGVLDIHTPLSGVTLSPGVDNLFFSAQDTTRTARATLRWREAYNSL